MSKSPATNRLYARQSSNFSVNGSFYCRTEVSFFTIMCATEGREFRIDFGCYGCILLASNPDSVNAGDTGVSDSQ